MSAIHCTTSPITSWPTFGTSFPPRLYLQPCFLKHAHFLCLRIILFDVVDFALWDIDSKQDTGARVWMDLAPSPFWRFGTLSVLYCFMFCGKDVKTTLEVSDRMDLAPSPFGVLDHCQCSIVSCFVEKTRKQLWKFLIGWIWRPLLLACWTIVSALLFQVLWKRRENNFGSFF